MGFAYQGNEDAYRHLSPVYFINENTVPIMVCHGEKDNVVPYCQGQELWDCLSDKKVKGIDCIFEPEGGHGFNMYSEENLKKMVDFFNKSRGK